jgi:hypothetical protein
MDFICTPAPEGADERSCCYHDIWTRNGCKKPYSDPNGPDIEDDFPEALFLRDFHDCEICDGDHQDDDNQDHEVNPHTWDKSCLEKRKCSHFGEPSDEKIKMYHEWINSLSTLDKEIYFTLFEEKALSDSDVNFWINDGYWDVHYYNLCWNVFNDWIDIQTEECKTYFENLEHDKLHECLEFRSPFLDSPKIQDHWERWYANECVDKFYSE